LKRNVNTLETENLEEKKTRNFRNVHQLHDLKPPISEWNIKWEEDLGKINN